MTIRWVAVAAVITCNLGGPMAQAGPNPPALPAGFNPHLRSVRGGQVDWGNGYILAEGQGKADGRTQNDRLMARRAAETVAARNALLIATGLQIDANGRFADLRNGEVQLRGVIKGHEVVAENWRPNIRPPEIVVTLRVPLWGAKGAVSIVYADQVRRSHTIGNRIPLSSDHGDVSDAVLVIDARGTTITPCLFPKITVTNGGLLYDIGTRSESAPPSSPPVRYAETSLTYDNLRASVEESDLQQSLTNAAPRTAFTEIAGLLRTTPDSLLRLEVPATSNPATSGPTSLPAGEPRRRKVVKAVKVTGKAATELVLTKEDADRLRQDPETGALLRDGQIVIVVDSVAAGIEGYLDNPDESALAQAR